MANYHSYSVIVTGITWDVFPIHCCLATEADALGTPLAPQFPFLWLPDLLGARGSPLGLPGHSEGGGRTHSISPPLSRLPAFLPVPQRPFSVSFLCPPASFLSVSRLCPRRPFSVFPAHSSISTLTLPAACMRRLHSPRRVRSIRNPQPDACTRRAALYTRSIRVPTICLFRSHHFAVVPCCLLQ